MVISWNPKYIYHFFCDLISTWISHRQPQTKQSINSPDCRCTFCIRLCRPLIGRWLSHKPLIGHNWPRAAGPGQVLESWASWKHSKGWMRQTPLMVIHTLWSGDYKKCCKLLNYNAATIFSSSRIYAFFRNWIASCLRWQPAWFEMFLTFLNGSKWVSSVRISMV